MGRNSPKSSQFQPRLAAESAHKLRRHRSQFGRVRAQLTDLGVEGVGKLGTCCSNSAEFGRFRPNWDDFDRSWPVLGEFDHSWPALGQRRLMFGVRSLGNVAQSCESMRGCSPARCVPLGWAGSWMWWARGPRSMTWRPCRGRTGLVRHRWRLVAVANAPAPVQTASRLVGGCWRAVAGRPWRLSAAPTR